MSRKTSFTRYLPPERQEPNPVFRDILGILIALGMCAVGIIAALWFGFGR